MTEIHPAPSRTQDRPFTDFGEMTRADRHTLAEALKERAERSRPSALGFHLRMTVVGFLGGSALILPAVLWLTGHLPLPSLPATGTSASITATAPSPDRPRLAATAPPTVAAAETDSQPAAQEPHVRDQDPAVREALLQRIASARDMLAKGEVEHVRKLLVADSADPDAVFLLAEAYDPNVIASLNVSVRPEVELARRYYTQALVGGIAAARQRLEALQ